LDAEINVPSVDDPELTNYFPLKPGAGKIINHAEEEEEEEKRKKKGHSVHRIIWSLMFLPALNLTHVATCYVAVLGFHSALLKRKCKEFASQRKRRLLPMCF